MRFWDTSALVPLLVDEAASATARTWLAEDRRIAAWTLTPVEALSAIRRLVREEALTERGAETAETLLREMARRLHLIVHVEHAKEQAARLLRAHALRAGDALQLGAALLWANGTPRGRIVHTFDARLAAAAAREGFSLVPPPE
jgi:uncharacterized protein